MKQNITRTKIRRIHFIKHYVSKKRNPIQYYAMNRIGGGVVLPMQKSEGVLSKGGFILRGFVRPPITLLLTES